MIEKAKFKFSAQDGSLELEGSEEFVSQHFDRLTDIVKTISVHTPIGQKSDSHEEQADSSFTDKEEKKDKKRNVETINDYPSVFTETNGKVNIVSDIPGSNKKERMTNAAMLYCYGSKLLGNEQVPSSEIRTVCEDHGCIDGANFSKIFNDKTIFLSDGLKGKNKQIKLTFRGEKKAKGFLQDDLNES